MTMAKAEKSQVSEVIAPDFQRMKRIFLHDLRGLEERSAKVRGDQSNAWKTIEKDAHCNKSGAKFVFKLLNMSDELRDDVLRTVYGGLKALNIGISQDLVDKMEGEDAPTMPTVDKSGGMGADNLVTLADRRPDPDAAAFENDAAQTQPAA
jgi:hypothetical protein